MKWFILTVVLLLLQVVDATWEAMISALDKIPHVRAVMFHVVVIQTMMIHLQTAKTQMNNDMYAKNKKIWR